jgi:DNA invertase Pin-like site-specific DNA recombinase
MSGVCAEVEVAARRRRTRAEIQQLVAEFVSSGMRRSEFCRGRGLSFSTLDRHLKKRRGKRKMECTLGLRHEVKGVVAVR